MSIFKKKAFQIFHKNLLYLCLAGYIAFTVISIQDIKEMMDLVHNEPMHIARDIREMQTRLNEAPAVVAGMISSPGITEEEMEVALKRIEDLQDKSLAQIKALYKDDPRKLAAVDSALQDVRKMRREVARPLLGKVGLDEARDIYLRRGASQEKRVAKAFEAIALSAEETVNAIQGQMTRRLNLAMILCLLIGALITAALIYADRKEKAGMHQLAVRDKIFNQLADNVEEFFLLTDSAGKIDYATPNIQRFMGITQAQVVQGQEAFLNLLPDADRNWLLRILSEPEISGEEESVFERGGRFYRIRIYNMAGAERGRKIVSVSDQTKDIQHQQALADALENAHAASAAKSSFLSHMSHEIRTPMNAIIGMTTIAISKFGDPARVRDCLGKIAESSRHLLGLINDILDMSKIESGRMHIGHEPFNLHRVIEGIKNQIRPQCQERKLNFDIFLEDVDEEELLGDALRLNQILLNILSNAIKFTPPGGEITLKIKQLRKTHNNVRLSLCITDTGIGMSQEFLERIFQPFEQAQAAATSRAGTGLGMTITANLVSLMGGSINIKSKEAQGTSITVELPFGLSERERKAEDLPPLKVLVVDDDHGTCEHASLLLEKMGLHPHWCLSGEEAVSKARAAHEAGNGYEVCLIDWKMPGMDGAETARQLRAVVGDDVLIIIISAYDWTPIESEARAAGVQDFIAKPFFASTLYDALLSATQRLDNAEAENKAVPATSSYDFSGRRILLVEDNEFNREIAQEFLEMVQATVENAANGKEAVEAFSAAAPDYYDMILMDVQMPLMDGYEATRAIRALDRADAGLVPILAMTANAFSDDVAQAIASGMDGHLAKPIDVNELYRLIHAHLEKKGQKGQAA